MTNCLRIYRILGKYPMNCYFTRNYVMHLYDDGLLYGYIDNADNIEEIRKAIEIAAEKTLL